MKGITPILGAIILLAITVSLVGSAWFFFTGLSEGMTSGVIQALPGSDQCVDNNRDIIIRNAGTEGIEIPGITANFSDAENDVYNGGFDIDGNGDGVPDGWFITSPSDIVLVTDLSNSMKRCMDDDFYYEIIPDNETFLLLHMNDNVVGDNQPVTESASGLAARTVGNVNCTIDGVLGKACYFNEDSRIVVEGANVNSPNLTQSITIAAWMNFDTQNDWGSIAIKGNGPNAPRQYHFAVSEGGYLHLAWNSKGVWVDQVDGPFVDTQVYIMDNQWHHAAVTWNHSLIQMYVDGLPVDSFDTSAYPMEHNVYNISIGGNLMDGYDFNGAIDELVIWNRSLSPEEVFALANNIFAHNAQASCPNDGNYTPSTCRHSLECPSNPSAWKAERDERYYVADFSEYTNTTLKNADFWENCGLNCQLIQDLGVCGSPITLCSDNDMYYNNTLIETSRSVAGACEAYECTGSGSTLGTCINVERAVCDDTSLNCGTYNPSYPYKDGITTPDVFPSQPSCNEAQGNCSRGIYDLCDDVTRSACDTSACSGYNYDLGMYWGADNWVSDNSTCTGGANGCYKDEIRYGNYQCLETQCPSGWEPAEVCSPSCNIGSVCCGEISTKEYNCPLKNDTCCDNEYCEKQEDRCCDEQYCRERYVWCCNESCTDVDACAYNVTTIVGYCDPGYNPGPPVPLSCSAYSYCIHQDVCYICDSVAIGLVRNVSQDFVMGVAGPDKNNVSLISYGSTNRTDSGLVDNATILYNIIDGYDADLNQTCISCAIKNAIDVLGGSTKRKVVVLMSDGEANTCIGDDPENPCGTTAATDQALGWADNASDEDITIHTIAFTSMGDVSTLKEIANKTGGIFFQGNDSEQIQSIYDLLAEQLGGELDGAVNVYGDYAMKLIAGAGEVYSDYIEIDQLMYSFTFYLRSNITSGDLLVSVRMYDETYSLINTTTLGTFNDSNPGFVRYDLDFNPLNTPGTRYVQISFKWGGANPSGGAWIDDVFFGPQLICERIDGRTAMCGGLTITKIMGEGDLIPFFSSNQFDSTDAVIFRDANCIEGNCAYRIIAESNAVNVRPVCY